MTTGLQRRTRRAFWAWCFAGGAALSFALSTPAAEPPTRVEPDLIALAKLAMITLPPPPAWPAAAAGTNWSVEDFSLEFAKSSDHAPRVIYSRTSFVRPPHAWLVAFAEWFNRLQKSLKLTYKDEAWDCDDFARCFVAFADMVALGAGESRGSICMGWATVFNRESFAGVDAGGGHAVVVVATSKGIFVIEPSNGKMAALGKYPNRDEFEDVYF
jgi:hypothetical protein